MRTLRLIAVLACALAVGAIAVTTATASILPGTAGTTIKGKSEKATLQVKGGASITCTKSTLSGEVLSTAEGSVIVDFSSCTTAGLPFNSLGDTGGTWLVHAVVKECPSDPSIVTLKLLPLHLEVPATKLLIMIEGAVLGTVEQSIKQVTYPLTITQKEGKNTVEVCKKEKLVLSTSTDGGAFVQSGLETNNASLTFGEEEEFM